MQRINGASNQRAGSWVEPDLTAHLQGSVLLADDEPINRKVGAAMLQKLGIEADVAGDGWEAVRLTGEKHYDLVLMDLQMPEMSGLDATEVIRKREQRHGLARVPIVAMTADAMESARARCLAIGMDDLIAKPIHPDVLRGCLQRWLPPAALRRETATGSSGQTPRDSERGEPMTPAVELVWDRRKALQFVGGDEPLLRELAGLFIERNASLLENIAQAIRRQDSVALNDAAHAYKGAVNHFGAAETRDLAFALEKKGQAGDLSGAETAFVELKDSGERLLKELQVYRTTGG